MLIQIKSIKLILVLILFFSAIGINISCSGDEKDTVNKEQSQKYYNEGLKKYEEKKWKEAVKLFNKSIQADPSYSDPYFRLGSFYQRTEDCFKAIENFEKVLEINTKAGNDLYYSLGFCYYNTRNYDKAIEAFKKAIQIKPDASYSVYFTLGVSYYVQKNYEEAVKSLNKSIQMKPTYVNSHYYYGKSLEKLGKYSEAIKANEYGLKQNPNSEVIMDLLAWYLATSPSEKDRDGKRAVRLAERAVDFTKGRDPLYLDSLAAAYAETGKFQDAVKTQERAISLLITSGGHDSEIKEFKEHLSSYKAKNPWRIK